jgi:hypothetical protein
VNQRDDGSSVLYPILPGFQDIILRIGGRIGTATASVEACFGLITGNWSTNQVPQLHNARWHPNTVLLADSSILVIGGDDDNPPANAAQPEAVYKPELFRHGTNAWVEQPPEATVRGYHSTAVLLPDGRVFVGGGNSRHDKPGTDYDIFTPHYLIGDPVRPTGLVINAPFQNDTYQLHYGQSYTLSQLDIPGQPKLGYSLARVALVSPGSVTHHSDMHQRYVECSVSPITTYDVSFAVPAETLAPRGYYMLFCMSSAGIPSEAVWVRVQQ